MAYTPPNGDAVDFNLTGAYSPPGGDDIGFEVGLTALSVEPNGLTFLVSVSTVSVVITLPLEVTPDSLGLVIGVGDGCVFEGIIAEGLSFAIGVEPVSVSQIYVAKAQDLAFSMVLSAAGVSLKPDYELPASVIGGMRFRFRGASDTQVERRSGFEASSENLVKAIAPWETPERVGSVMDAGFGDMGLFFNITHSPWLDVSQVEWSVVSGFFERGTFYNAPVAPWGVLGYEGREAVSPWLVPPEVNVLHESGFFDMAAIGDSITAPWLIPPEVNRFHETLWGRKYYEKICVRAYSPPAGDGCVFNLSVPLTLCGDGDHCNFFFDSLSYDARCSQREPSGWRENFTFKPVFFPVPRPKVLGVYIVNNNAMLCRVSDRAPIGVLSMSLSSKIDSWCWEFQAVLASTSDLALVTASDGSPVPVEVEINGWTWVVMIEGSDGSRQFPKGSWSVSGRSVSAELAAPYAPVSSYTESSSRLAQQLAASGLDGTGWSLDWDIPDWLVPAGVFSVSNQTALETVLSVARAVGGEVQSHRTDTVLSVMSRYPVSPWNWATATPVLSLHESVILTLGWESDRRPGYNGIYVSGATSGGVLVFVKRYGTEGDTQAQMITEPLITAVEAGQERGRVELGKAGRWSVRKMSLPLMSGSDLPGLLSCGDLIQVEEGSGTWRGQVIEVAVSASRQNGLKVYQNIEVERFHG